MASQYDAGYVVQVPNLGYMVRSRSVEGAWWLVSGKDCSCPAGQNNRTVCFHRVQVKRYTDALNEKHRRPRAQDTGESVVSRFVD